MKPPAWVNWEQFANLNEEETKRAEQNRQQARAEEQENFLKLTGQLQNEAMGQAGARQFGGLEKIGKFKDVMDARDAALKNQTPMMGAAWEQYLDPGKNAPYRSPWANLDQRLGQITESAERNQKASMQLDKDRREREEKEANAKVAKKAAQEADKVTVGKREGAISVIKNAFPGEANYVDGVRAGTTGRPISPRQDLPSQRFELMKLVNLSGLDPSTFSDPYVKQALMNLGFTSAAIDSWVSNPPRKTSHGYTLAPG